ncbi:hypothetical protein PTE30175_04471 [Pandoraea terrae]|uniref:Uncharacterized protein n=1 Tax=Pandoraea terrae TaxID=1537710 RepID=A0A5E4YJM3_9BURK|nr:hypothetical protein PTE30175_04471 [Pandoraea terrae]
MAGANVRVSVMKHRRCDGAVSPVEGGRDNVPNLEAEHESMRRCALRHRHRHARYAGMREVWSAHVSPDHQYLSIELGGEQNHRRRVQIGCPFAGFVEGIELQ